MKTKIKKDFDTIKFAREQKDRLDALFAKMTKEEILEYLKSKRREKNHTNSTSL
jgi:hypothetical protein